MNSNSLSLLPVRGRVCLDPWPLSGPASQGTGSFHALSWNVHFGHSLSRNTVAVKREAACGLCGQKVASASSLSGSWWLQAQLTSDEWEDLSSSVRVVREWNDDCLFKPLIFGMVCYAAIDDWNVPKVTFQALDQVEGGMYFWFVSSFFFFF